MHIDSRRACDDDHALSLSLGLVGRLRELQRQIKLPEDSTKIKLRFISQDDIRPNPAKYGNILPAFMNDIASLRDFAVMYRDPPSISTA